MFFVISKRNEKSYYTYTEITKKYCKNIPRLHNNICDMVFENFGVIICNMKCFVCHNDTHAVLKISMELTKYDITTKRGTPISEALRIGLV